MVNRGVLSHKIKLEQGAKNVPCTFVDFLPIQSNVYADMMQEQMMTRSSNRQDLYLPGGKHKVLYTDSFVYSGAIIWNNLSPSIRNCSNLNQFKSTYLND